MLPLDKYTESGLDATLIIKNMINQTTTQMSVSLTISVIELKRKIEDRKESTKQENIRVVFAGHLLNDYFSLHNQGIRNQSTIYVISPKPEKAENQKENEKPQPQSSQSITINVIQIISSNIQRRRKVKVNLNQLIQKLDSVFSEGSMYIFKGIILEKEESFNSYCFNDDDTVFVMSSDDLNNNRGLVLKWIDLSKDDHTLLLCKNTKIYKEKSLQSAKMIDMRFNKIELRKHSYRSTFIEESFLKKNCNELIEGEKNHSITNYGSVSQPSTNPLPEIL